MADLLAELESIVEQFNGRFGLFARHLQSGETISVYGDSFFPTASVIKLPVLCALMAQVEDGTVSLDEPLMLRRADQMGGSGMLKKLTPGLIMPVRDWAMLMMNISDNSATNVLIDHVGLSFVQQWLADQPFPDLFLHNKIDFPALVEDLNHFGTATPHALTDLLTAVFRRELFSEASTEFMMQTMEKVGADRVGRYLPFEPFDTAVSQSERLQLAGKTGSFKGTRAQTAVVWRGEWPEVQGFVLTAMNTDNPEPETWHTDAPGVLAIGHIAQLIYRAWMI